MQDFTKKAKQMLSNLFSYSEKKSYSFSLSQDPDKTEKKSDLKESTNIKDDQKVFPALSVNLEYIEKLYFVDINSDIKIRPFKITARSKEYSAFLLYIDGLCDTDSISDSILHPLMLKKHANLINDNPNQVYSDNKNYAVSVKKVKKVPVSDYIFDCLLPENDVKKQTSFSKIAESVNSGNCILFVDTLDFAFDIDIKKFQQRSIAEPKNEPTIKGAQEAFVENIRTNTSLIRRGVNNQNLIIENLEIGKLEKNRCAVCYLKDVANNSLVEEVKYRLNNLDIDYILSAGELCQFIQDNPKTGFPEIISTERNDNACSYLLQGRVVVLLNGSPYALIMPGVLVDFMSSPEDANLNYHFSNLLKILRLIGFIITLLLPGLYIGITTYHRELIPTELLYSIISSRTDVPFPILVEIIIMEVSFELIREAGLRVPSPIGPTVGIVGGLVLGQAAVSAKIVSPILIIIVAITGIASFSVPDFSLGFELRINRFLYTILGFLGGFLGIAFGLFIQLLVLCSLKSFGVSYLAPYAPFMKIRNNGYFIKPAWKREKRADFLNTKKTQAQSHISMSWRK